MAIFMFLCDLVSLDRAQDSERPSLHRYEKRYETFTVMEMQVKWKNVTS
jgi:hypothetical protein